MILWLKSLNVAIRADTIRSIKQDRNGIVITFDTGAPLLLLDHYTLDQVVEQWQRAVASQPPANERSALIAEGMEQAQTIRSLLEQLKKATDLNEELQKSIRSLMSKV